MNVLVLSPHPDDEVLGCGGTVTGLALAGHRVDVLYLTSGEAGGHGTPPDEVAKIREEEARAAAAVLGIQSTDFWRLPDGGLEVQPAIVDRLRERLAGTLTDRVYVTHPDEDHPDHRAAAALLAGAVDAMDQDSRPEVLYMEVWTPLTRFTDVVDISGDLEVKMTALRCHVSQCKVMDFEAASRGLSRYRGEMHSWPGGPHAEVFQRGNR